MSLNVSHVEDAALEWFGELGYAASGMGPDSLGYSGPCLLSRPVYRRRSGIRFLRWNPAIPSRTVSVAGSRSSNISMNSNAAMSTSMMIITTAAAAAAAAVG